MNCTATYCTGEWCVLVLFNNMKKKKKENTKEKSIFSTRE